MKKLTFLGYNLNKPHYLFIFRLQNQDYQHTESLDAEKDLITNTLRKYTAIVKENMLVSNSFEQIQALISEDFLSSHNWNAKKFGDIILKEVKKKFPSSQLLIGISNTCTQITEIHEGYKQAKKALEITQFNNQKQQVILFSSIGHISILLDARNPKELENYADQILGPVYAYDIEKSAELLKTLYFYLYNECNLHKTARYLNFSIGGMRYRLASLKERFNIDMMKSNTRREVQMALDIYLAFGKLSSIHLDQER